MPPSRNAVTSNATTPITNVERKARATNNAASTIVVRRGGLPEGTFIAQLDEHRIAFLGRPRADVPGWRHRIAPFRATAARGDRKSTVAETNLSGTRNLHGAIFNGLRDDSFRANR